MKRSRTAAAAGFHFPALRALGRDYRRRPGALWSGPLVAVSMTLPYRVGFLFSLCALEREFGKAEGRDFEPLLILRVHASFVCFLFLFSFPVFFLSLFGLPFLFCSFLFSLGGF